MKTPHHWIDRDRLHRFLRTLDIEVTGKSETHKKFTDFPDDFEFGGVQYHLSDGGRSSVMFGKKVGRWTGHLFINDTASSEAKQKFDQLFMLRAVIETFSLCGGEKESQ